jgi:hypothetical protein
MLLLLFPMTVCAQMQPEFGARFNYHTVFIHSNGSDTYMSRYYRPGFQTGLFLKTRVVKGADIRAEVSYSLMGHFIQNIIADHNQFLKIDYHYLGASIMSDIHVVNAFSVGIGGFTNFLFQGGMRDEVIDGRPLFYGGMEAGSKRYFDTGPLVSVFLRYNSVEIQARYQYSLTPFIAQESGPDYNFSAFSVGLAYYFITKNKATP